MVRRRNLSRDDVSGGARRIEMRTVRYWRADSPLLESGQSAVESRILSRDVAVSGGLDK